jgi:hypothetical protein
MKENKSVMARLNAALLLLKNERPGQPICISELCRQAGVNRSNLYANHAQLLAEIRSYTSREKQQNTVTERNCASESGEIEVLRTQNKALLYLCLELRSRLDDLTSRSPQTGTRLNSAGESDI